MKKYLPYILIAILLVGFVGIIGYLKVSDKKTGDANQTQTETEPYFDDSANVMYFYSPNCSFCIKEKPILADLAKEGYRVKPIDIQANPGFAIQYDVKGTPYFISQKDGAKLNGFQEKEPLKKFLEEHK